MWHVACSAFLACSQRAHCGIHQLNMNINIESQLMSADSLNTQTRLGKWDSNDENGIASLTYLFAMQSARPGGERVYLSQQTSLARSIERPVYMYVC